MSVGRSRVLMGLLIFAVGAMIAVHPASALIAPQTAQAVAVDGVLSPGEWKGAANPMDAANSTAPGVVVQGATASAADASASVYVQHDADYLYVAVSVNDDTVVPTAPYVWDADSVEVFLDHDNSRTSNIGVNRVQFAVAAGGATAATPSVPAGSWISAAAIRSGGYTVELRISKSHFALSGRAYGFDIAISDVEPAGTLATRYWHTATAEASTNESLWGQITLEALSQNQAPVVNAGPNRTLTWPGRIAVLSGTVTDDGLPNPPGKASPQWSKLSGPGTVVIGSPYAATTAAVFNEPGQYVFELSASDGALTGADTVTVTVNRPNQPPFVLAGQDQTITWPANSVNLRGTAMDDGLPNPPGALTLTWSKTTGPGNVTFANANMAETTATFDAPGTYQLKLTADDGQTSSSDRIVVRVLASENQAPRVDAGLNRVLLWPLRVLMLDATVTDDGRPSPPSAVTTSWSKLSGPAPVTIPNPSAVDALLSFSTAGLYEFELSATDGQLSASDTVTVHVVSGPNAAAPFAQAPVSVDGRIIASEWHSALAYPMDAANTVVPGVVVQGAQVAAADASAKVYVQHDASYLYVAVDVTDDQVVTVAGNVWDGDSVELFLDADNSNTVGIGVNRIQFDLSAIGDGAATSAVPAGSWNGAASSRPGGYTVEFRVSKAAFGLASTGTYGFDVAINDAEPTAGTIGTRYWLFSTAEAAADESKWGDLVLLPAPGQAPDPVLATSTDRLEFGTSASQMSLEVWNVGSGLMSYTVTENASWLSVSPLSGESIGERDTLTFSVNRSLLTPGTSQTDVIVNAGTAGTATVTVVVQVPAGGLTVTPSGGLVGSLPKGGPLNPISQVYTLVNSGGSAIAWTGSKTQSWLILSKAGGTLAAGASDTVTVSINSAATALGVGSYGDVVTFTNTTNGNGNTNRSVSLSVNSAASYAPMQTASRTSGLAPLAVFFDAVPSGSGVVQPSGVDYASQHYVWDFGDTPSSTFSTTGRSKNTATGYVAAHVYENPGTYRVILTATAATGRVYTYEQTITVTGFAGTTYYVSSSQGSDGNNGTSSSTPFQSFAKGLSMAGANRRILFRRGDTWTAGTGVTLSASGPGIVGAYGTGPAPVIRITGTGAAISMRGTDWRIMDLELIGPGDSSQVAGIEGSNLTRNLILRTTVRRFRVGFAYGWTGASVHAENTIADSAAIGNVINNGYVGGQKIAVLGTRFETPDVSHLLRVWGIRKGVISNNYMNAPGGDRLALKLHNEIALKLPDAECIVISDNDMRGHVYVVSIAPQAWDYDERIKDVVFERNTLRSMSDTFTALIVEAQRVTIRNNIFNGDGAGDWYTGMSVRGNAAGSPDHKVYNNTVYRGQTGKEFTAVSAGGADVRNNLASAPGTPNAVFGTSTSNNLLSNNPGFNNPAAGDFSLRTGSPARDTGITLPHVRDSLNGRPRPQGGAYDLGATEQ